MLARILALCGFLACGAVATAWAQGGEGVKIRSKAVEIELGGRLHTQFNTTSVDGEPASEFLIRRARPEFGIVVNDWIEGKLTIDFGEGELDLKDAYVKLNFDPALEVTLGQFKRPFDLFELTSSTQFLVIERTGKIRGANVLSLSEFTEELRYSDRDIGIRVEGRDRAGRFQWSGAITNGDGANEEDEDGVKAYQVRVGYTPIPELTVWGGVSGTPYAVESVAGAPDPLGEHDQAHAFQVDAEWGNFDQGLHLQGGLVVGDNWIPVEGTGVDAPSLIAWQVIGGYKTAVRGNRFVSAVEPIFRLSQGNPDTDVANDGGVLATPGFVVHFVGRNRFAVNWDVWTPEGPAPTETSFRAQVYLHF